ILWRAPSRASDLVKPMMPALAAEYGDSPRLPTRPASLETNTILPPPACAMAGNSARVSRNGPSRVIAMTLSMNSCVASMNGCVRSQPATLTSTSILPCARASASRAQASMLAPSVNSSLMNSTPPAWANPIVSCAPASFVSHRKTRAPSAASMSTAARPMPEAPPVSSTVLYLSCIVPSLSSLRGAAQRRRSTVARMDAREGGGKSGIPHSPSLHAGYKSPPRAGEKIADPALGLLGCQQPPGPFGLRRKAVALGIAREPHAHLAGGKRQRMQARDASRDRQRLRGEISARDRPLHHAQFARGFSVDGFGREDDGGGARRPGEPGEALRSPAARQQPKGRLRQSQLRLLRGNAQVTSERQLVTTAHCRAADFGERDLRQVADALKQLLE